MVSSITGHYQATCPGCGRVETFHDSKHGDGWEEAVAWLVQHCRETMHLGGGREHEHVRRVEGESGAPRVRAASGKFGKGSLVIGVKTFDSAPSVVEFALECWHAVRMGVREARTVLYRLRRGEARIVCKRCRG